MTIGPLDIGFIGADLGTVMGYITRIREPDRDGVTEPTTTEKTRGFMEGFVSLLASLWNFLFSSSPPLASRSITIETPKKSEENDEVFRPDGQDQVAAPAYQAPKKAAKLAYTEPTQAEKDKMDITKWEAPKKSLRERISDSFELFGQRKKEEVVPFMDAGFYEIYSEEADDGY